MCDVRKVVRYQRGNQKLQIEEVQTIQWPKEKGQKEKQLSTKHYTENKRLNNRIPTKTRGWTKALKNG